MSEPGFNLLSQVDQATQSALILDRLVRRLRGVFVAGYEFVCLAFDRQWERRQRAYERRVLSTMNARERADIGLSPRNDSDDPVTGFWRE
jgi:uncharacterized protein YjiS (DUF1127 family)